MMQDSDMPWYSGQHFVVLSVFLVAGSSGRSLGSLLLLSVLGSWQLWPIRLRPTRRSLCAFSAGGTRTSSMPSRAEPEQRFAYLPLAKWRFSKVHRFPHAEQAECVHVRIDALCTAEAVRGPKSSHVVVAFFRSSPRVTEAAGCGRLEPTSEEFPRGRFCIRTLGRCFVRGADAPRTRGLAS